MDGHSSRITCPVCGLVLMADARTFSYDVADWAQRCPTPASGSPTLCPSLRPQTLAAIANVTSPRAALAKMPATLH